MELLVRSECMCAGGNAMTAILLRFVWQHVDTYPVRPYRLDLAQRVLVDILVLSLQNQL